MFNRANKQPIPAGKYLGERIKEHGATDGGVFGPAVISEYIIKTDRGEISLGRLGVGPIKCDTVYGARTSELLDAAGFEIVSLNGEAFDGSSKANIREN